MFGVYAKEEYVEIQDSGSAAVTVGSPNVNYTLQSGDAPTPPIGAHSPISATAPTNAWQYPSTVAKIIDVGSIDSSLWGVGHAATGRA